MTSAPSDRAQDLGRESLLNAGPEATTATATATATTTPSPPPCGHGRRSLLDAGPEATAATTPSPPPCGHGRESLLNAGPEATATATTTPSPPPCDHGRQRQKRNLALRSALLSFSFSFSFSFPSSISFAALALAGLTALSGCPQRTTEPPQPPPRIYVDPHAPAPSSDRDRSSPDDDGSCPKCAEPKRAEPSGPTFAPTDPATPGDRPGFRDTLEGIPSEAPADGRDGLAGATTCENGARQVGESWKEECNTCSCEPSGEVICTLMACINVSGDDV